MRPLPIVTQEESNKLIVSIYETCVFGNGTVNERDKKLVKAKLIPSYMQAKWVRFNKLGLNQTKVENAFIMFFANTTTIVLDLVVLPLALSAGQAQIHVIPIVVDTAKLVLAPIPKLLIQEYFERKFNREMFSETDPKFLTEMQNAEKFIVQKHRVDFTLADGYLEILKNFTKLPMLNFIFFYAQMTEEFVIYRKKYKKKEDISFQNMDDAVEYFKITFRMMRFFYHTEIHALNYFFNNAFYKIMNFYLNVESLKEKYLSVFYSEKRIDIMKDTENFLGHLNFKIQKSKGSYRIKQEICEETCLQFQHFYFPFFYDQRFDYSEVISFIETPEIKSMLQLSYDDSITLRNVLSTLQSAVGDQTGGIQESVKAKSMDFLHLILNTLTGVTSSDRTKQIKGSMAIVGLGLALGGVVTATALGIKNREKIKALYSRIKDQLVPATSFFETQEKQINSWFNLDAVVFGSTAGQVIGSMLFIAGHIPGLSTLGGAISILRELSPFNPIKDLIIRSAEKYTKRRLEELDLSVLRKVDRGLRLGYTEHGDLVVKIFCTDGTWRENFSMEFVQEDFLYFLTHDFARVVRHECENMGFLFEQIALLDREIEQFGKPSAIDFLYTGRDEKGPTYFAPMCRITAEVTPEITEMRAKQRFFDILIERQSLLIMLINRSYYVSIYNLFMNKLKDCCSYIFKDHLPHGIEMFERFKYPLDFEMKSFV